MPRAILGLVLLAGLSCAAPAAAQRGAWIGAAGTGCEVWDPAPAPGRSASWSGACSAGRASGQGTLVWSQDGRPVSRYAGEMRDGAPHGRGVTQDGARTEGLYYRGRLVVSGSIKQGLLMRAAPLQADAAGRSEEGACAIEIVVSSAVPRPVDLLAGLLVMRRNGAVLRTRKFNLEHLVPNELRVASFDLFDCGKPAAPGERTTVELGEISLCDIGGQPRSDCDRLITFAGKDETADNPPRPRP